MQIELLESPSSFIYFPLDSLDNSANLHCSIRSPNICLIHYLLLFPFQLPIPLKPSIITTSLTSHLSHLKKSAQISSPLGLHASDPTWRPLPWIGGSTGSPFHIFPECVARVPVSLWGSGGWGCVRSTLRSRAQPFATVRAIPVWPCLWEVLQRWSFLEVSPYRSGKVFWSKIGNSKTITFLKIILVDFLKLLV